MPQHVLLCLKSPVCSTISLIGGRRKVGSIPFQRVLVQCGMQTATSRIWTRVASSISFEDNRYATSIFLWCYQVSYSATKRDIKRGHWTTDLIQNYSLDNTITFTYKALGLQKEVMQKEDIELQTWMPQSFICKLYTISVQHYYRNLENIPNIFDAKYCLAYQA